MTEEEAQLKWCPFTRVGEQASGAAENRPDGSFNCIGSACMAWRRDALAATTNKLAAIREHRQVHGSDILTAKNAVEAGWAPGRDTGYCGLAGAVS